MTYGVVQYTHFMTVGIDEGVFRCGACGALVPYDGQDQHDNFHLLIRVMAGGGDD